MNAAHELAHVDLNLLVAFDALVRTRSVTLAAEQLGVTQSAVSHTLRRLRALLGDPLLVRGRAGMLLTPRAQALVLPLRSGLNTLERALAEPAAWDARSARRAFSLATPDLFDVVVVPRLLERVRRDAPGVDITLVPIDPQRLHQQLESGELDGAVVPQIQDLPRTASEPSATGLVRTLLFRDRHTCMLRAGHAALRGLRKASRLSLQRYAELSHLLVSPQGSGPGMVDQLLEKHRLTRRVALRMPHFYSALAIVAASDLILTAPSALAPLAAAGSIVQLEPPLRLPPHHVSLLWHERFSHDPGHTWLREQLRAVSPG